MEPNTRPLIKGQSPTSMQNLRESRSQIFCTSTCTSLQRFHVSTHPKESRKGDEAAPFRVLNTPLGLADESDLHEAKS